MLTFPILLLAIAFSILAANALRSKVAKRPPIGGGLSHFPPRGATRSRENSAQGGPPMLTFPILLLVIAFVCFVFEAIRSRSVLAELLGLRAVRWG